MAEFEDFFSLALIAIQDRIKAQVPEIRWVDMDYGQLDYYDMDQPAVAWPCLLVDFNNTTYDQLLEQLQTGNASITCRLAIPAFSQSSGSAPASVKEKALAFLKLEKKVYLALQNFDGGELFQPLTRTAAVTERKEQPIRCRLITFSTRYEDESAMAVLDRIARPRIDFDFTN